MKLSAVKKALSQLSDVNLFCPMGAWCLATSTLRKLVV